MSFIEDSRYFDDRAKMRVICKCGCSSYIPSFRDKTMCRWCGRTVYKSPKDEFINKMNLLLKNNQNVSNRK